MKKLAIVLALSLVAVACKRSEQATTGTSGFTFDSTKTAQTRAPRPPVQVGTEVGATMPEYSATLLDGSKFDLASKRGKVVLLNVWATWCGPCRFEIPELQRLHNEYSAKGLEVVGVSVDESGVEAVKEFVAEQKMTYPVALDPEAKIASLLQASVLPTTVLVGKDGRVLWKKAMVVTENDPELKKAIESAL
jgi:cytochrome c biogenesis protein CcmG, thiol:disulfide interchange protein DsbE